MAELHDEPAVIVMDALADLAPERNLVVMVDHGVAGQDAPAHRDRGVGGYDGADAAPGELLLPVQPCIAAGSAKRGPPLFARAPASRSKGKGSAAHCAPNRPNWWHTAGSIRHPAR